MAGLLITFEGIDFCGKSVQARLLYENIQKELNDLEGQNVILIREPGGTQISEQIRDILLNQAFTMIHPITELLLYEAARSQVIAEIIIPCLKKDKIVICDRFYDSTTAYQGYGRGIGLNKIKEAHQIATHGIRPDLTFIIDIDPTVAVKRQKCTGSSRDRMESESVEFYIRVRQGYLNISKEESDRTKVINGDDSIENISAHIWKVVKERFNLMKETSRTNNGE